MDVREFLDEDGRNPFRVWFKALDAMAAARIGRADATGDGQHIEREGRGWGVFELNVDFGPGYRVYFGKDGKEIVVLLGGGTKKRQDRDIESAQANWQRYKSGKKA